MNATHGKRGNAADYRTRVLEALKASAAPMIRNQLVREVNLSLPAEQRELGRTADSGSVMTALRRLVSEGLVAPTTVELPYNSAAPTFTRELTAYAVVVQTKPRRKAK